MNENLTGSPTWSPRSVHPGAPGPVVPETARAGNIYGMAGMAIAIVRRCWRLRVVSYSSLVGILIGGSVGTVIALRIQMTALPQLVAAFHSLVGYGRRPGGRGRVLLARGLRNRAAGARSTPPA